MSEILRHFTKECQAILVTKLKRDENLLNKGGRRCDTDIANFLDEHASDKDDRQYFCPIDGWSVGSEWIEFEEKNIREK